MKNHKAPFDRVGKEVYIVGMTDSDYVNHSLEELSIDRALFSEYLERNKALDKRESAVYYLHRLVMRIVFVDISPEQMESLTTVATGEVAYPYCFDLDVLYDILAGSKFKDLYKRWMMSKIKPLIAKS